MTRIKTDGHVLLVDEPLDPEVLAFREQFDCLSLLDLIVREGAQRML